MNSNKALGALAEYRADRTKTVDLRFAGAGQRRVVIGYVHEMPVWKTSYRLQLPELDSEGKTKGQLMLHGWAIVENTTDQDWSDVQLSLVSGRPVSFQMDLYEPLFATRPWVSVPTIPGVSPRVSRAVSTASPRRSRWSLVGTPPGLGMTPLLPARALMVPSTPPPPGAAPRRPPSDVLTVPQALAKWPTTRQVRRNGQSIGEVFAFQVETPVSLERQRSAMIPILAANINRPARLHLQRFPTGRRSPCGAFEITNDSSLALLPGPISVLDQGGLRRRRPDRPDPKDDKRLLAYALDLDMAVITKPANASTVTKIMIVDGQMRSSIKDRLTTSYELANKDTKSGRTVILEHPYNSEYTLVEH